MTDAELDELRRVAANHRDDPSSSWAATSASRAFEIPQIRPEHVKRTPDGDHYRLRVPKGKDTTGNGGKPRDSYLPADVEGDVHRYQNAEDIAPDDLLIDPHRAGCPRRHEAYRRACSRRNRRRRLSVREFARPPSTLRPASPRRPADESSCRDGRRWLGLLPGHRTVPQRPDGRRRQRRLEEAGLA